MRRISREIGSVQMTNNYSISVTQVVAERVGFELRDTETPATKAETFHWTSPAKEACVVETDRQIDLCSEHAKRPASVPGLWWCKWASDQEVNRA